MPKKEDPLANLNTYILTIDGSYRTKELIRRLELDDFNPKSVLGIDGRNKSKHFFKNTRHDYLSWLTLGRSLTNEEIDKLQLDVRTKIVEQFKVELR